MMHISENQISVPRDTTSFSLAVKWAWHIKLEINEKRNNDEVVSFG